ncbi:hypothetical protein [Amygdalobacter nucleatus]|uniref:hypothetical protein n=1 Tax=Amygdalobacter nucleatus TaxID=3029274 RepID=UPI0027A93858|nr:hypothetical protein [Amygdalobacter nucleatus]WEG36743.1 hypothetical protein PYS63_06280 [Amygdalobacter nucleatus]
MKTKMHANVFKKKCLAAITAMLMAALLVVPANVKAVENNEPYDALSADLLLRKDGKESTGKEVIEVGKDDNMTFVGTLGVKIIKGQMNCFEKKFLGDGTECDPNTCKENELLKDNYDKINLEGVESTFKATLTLADGLKFKDKVETTLTGANNLFKIKKTEINENRQTATITMELRDKDKYKKYDVLKNDVNAVNDDLKVSLTGVQFADNAKADTPYEVTGAVTGSFRGTAQYSIIKKEFDLSWTGVQTDKGKYKGRNDIAIAVQYAAAPAPAPAPAPVEPEVEIPYVPSDPVEPVVTEVVEPKVGKVAKTGEMANTVNQLGLIILAAASVVIAKKH